jgi:hypothetical protein
MPHAPTANTLFYGDNLNILRDHIETVLTGQGQLAL